MSYAVTVKPTESVSDERSRRLTVAYNVVLQRFSQWAEARLSEIDDQLEALRGDPGAWRERLQLRRERRRLRRLLRQGGGS